MIDVVGLEKKIVALFKRKKALTIDDLIDKVSLYELFHVVVFKDEFASIKLVNIDLNQKHFFNDGKYKDIPVPYFEIERKGVKE